jgi:NAD(P)-dependent dehydrogenase (short-subunit alcohol dehydrogenase family)
LYVVNRKHSLFFKAVNRFAAEGSCPYSNEDLWGFMDVIAVVTGASRGAGKGIAIALGETGATVYVTGRSAAEGDSPYGGTVTQTADLITRAGGKGVAIALHTDDEAVAALFARVKAERGRLDIPVNNAANAAESTTMPGGFWEKPLDAVDLITVGLRSHFVSAYYAAPLLIANRRGLIVHTGHYGAVAYYHGPAYGAQKAGAYKMAADFAKELRPYNIAAVAIWMGGLNTERARAYLARVRTLLVKLPFVSVSSSEGLDLWDRAASASALCVSTI